MDAMKRRFESIFENNKELANTNVCLIYECKRLLEENRSLQEMAINGRELEKQVNRYIHSIENLSRTNREKEHENRSF